MLTTPKEQDLDIYKGDDFEEILVFESASGSAVNMTDWTGKAQCRTKRKRTATLIVEFTVTITDPPNGKVKLSLTDPQTGAVTRSSGYWDLLLTDENGLKETYAYGEVVFHPTVTTD